MSGSEQSEVDSEGSNLDVMKGGVVSQYSSPAQQVPGSAGSSRVSTEEMSLNDDNVPYLKITIQPQIHFRFRYKTERESGTHGCLQGRSRTASNAKTYPTVELKNFSGTATLKVKLSQQDKDVDHLHTLHEDGREFSAKVPDEGSYTVCFQGLGIIHTAKRDIPSLLFNKRVKEESKKISKKELREECKREAKLINLNAVRLRFSAHDCITDKEICKPAFSETIYNMKSPETNVLKICYSSRCYGKPKGGDVVVLLVEKVKKGKVRINFFETDAQGNRRWETNVQLMDSNIHHQTAILFNTPAYEDPEISDDRQVYIELQRFPYEERSNSVPFTYRPQGGEGFHKKRKRPKVNASNSPAMSTRSTSDTSSSGLRTPQQFTRTQHKIYVEQSTQTPNWDTPCNISQPTKYDGSILDNYESNGFNLDNIDSNTEDNFYIPKGYTMEEYNVMPTCNYQDMNEVFSKNLINNPVFGQPNVPNPVGRLVPMESPNSNDISNDLDMAEIFNHDWNEYIAHYLEDVPAVNDDGDFRPNLVSDSGRACPVKEDSTSSKDQSNDESVFFKGKEVQEVKKLIKEICDLKLQKPSDWDTEVRVKLDRLFDIRLSNGDTFLHMTLTSHLPSFEFVVNAVHSVNMGHLLDEDNRDELTVLHLAIAKHMPDTVAYLVEKGCDPMCADRDQNTAIHRAVTCKFCLTALLNAAKKKGSKCNLNQGNSEWQTPLHLAATHDCAESTRLLLEHGADTQLALDNSGRTPLHIAVQNDNKDVVATLLQFVPVREVDSVNCLGMTALQIACSGSVRQNTLEIIKLLLDKGASPTISERRNEPAYKMAKCYPKTWDIMKKYLSDYYIDDDSTDESDDDHSSDDSDDDFLSADEGLDDSEGPLDEVTTKLKNL